ncbi:MAG: hypothetical protein ABIH28_01755 [archaeon]
MSLEQKTNEFMLEGEFNSENFVKTGKIYQDIGKWIQTLQKDVYNKDAFEKAGKLFVGDKDFYSPTGINPKFKLEDTFSVLTENRAKYAKERYSNMANGFSDEHWMGLISNLPLYKTGNKSHDEIVDAMIAKRKVDEASEDSNKMFEFLSKKSEGFDGPFQAEFRRERYNESYLKKLFGIYQKEAVMKYLKLLHNEDGKLKKGLAKSVFETSLKTAEREMERETNEGDKSDIWEADVRPYYLALDHFKYKLEDNELEEKEEKNKDNKTKDRQKTRRDMGMSN